jgi:hypothetical protein
VSEQFTRAYSILTQHVWPIYFSKTAHHARFQRYLLGSALFYHAKAIICAAQHEKQQQQYHPTLVLLMARRAEYIFTFLLADAALGYQPHAQKLAVHVQKWIERMLRTVMHDFPFRDRITSPGMYAAGEHLMAISFSPKMAYRLMLAHHYKTDGRMFRSNPAYCSLLRACLFQAPAQKQLAFQ